MNSTSTASEALRVTVVSETYPPEVNGVAGTVARFAEGLVERGHAVQLLRPRQADDAAAVAASRIPTRLVHGLPIPRYPQLRMGVPARGCFDALWAAQRPHVVHIATEGPLGLAALWAARRRGIVVTSDFRTNFHAYAGHYGLGFLRRPMLAYLRAFHNACAVTMAPTQPLRRELVEAGFRNVEVVARGVDTRLFSPARRSAELRASWSVEDGDIVVACVGRLAAEKNLGVLLDAFAAIRRTQPRARLLLVGDGPHRAALEQRVPEAIFAGRRTGEDLAAHYASADLFLFPSLTETFGNVTPEAMASGLPVVAFDYAAAAELIETGATGVRVPFGDSEAFARAACELAGAPAVRAALGEAARRRALAQDWDAVIGRFEAALQRAATGALPPADTLPLGSPA